MHSCARGGYTQCILVSNTSINITFVFFTKAPEGSPNIYYTWIYLHVFFYLYDIWECWSRNKSVCVCVCVGGWCSGNHILLPHHPPILLFKFSLSRSDTCSKICFSFRWPITYQTLRTERRKKGPHFSPDHYREEALSLISNCVCVLLLFFFFSSKWSSRQTWTWKMTRPY